MSKDKNRAERRGWRLLEILRLGGGRAGLNTEGGLPASDRDLKRLVTAGFVKVVRYYVHSWAGPHIRRSYAERTSDPPERPLW